MKAVIIPLIILIITFLSEQITIEIFKASSTTVIIHTMLFSVVLNKNGRKKHKAKFFENIKHFIASSKFLLKNSSVAYSYDISSKHKLVFKTHVIILFISLTIFLYSKTKSLLKKRIKYV